MFPNRCGRACRDPVQGRRCAKSARKREFSVQSSVSSWGAHMVWLGGTQNSHVTGHPHQDLLGAEGAKSRTTQANHDIGLL